MKKDQKKCIAVLPALLALIFSFGCGDSGSSNNGFLTPPLVLLITPADAIITKGNTQQFNAIAKESGNNAYYELTVAWYSSDPNIAKIENIGGLATGIEIGTVTITAWYHDDIHGYVSGQTKLTVQ